MNKQFWFYVWLVDCPWWFERIQRVLCMWWVGFGWSVVRTFPRKNWALIWRGNVDLGSFRCADSLVWYLHALCILSSSFFSFHRCHILEAILKLLVWFSWKFLCRVERVGLNVDWSAILRSDDIPFLDSFLKFQGGPCTCEGLFLMGMCAGFASF